MSGRRGAVGMVASLLLISSAGVAQADELPDGTTKPPRGDVQGNDLISSVSRTKIEIESPGGGTREVPTGRFTSSDPDWEPPACWYEPVMTPEQLKAGTEKLGREGGMGAVNAHEWWTDGLFVDHYKDGKPDDGVPGYDNYNLGKDGMWWRSVVREGHEDDVRAWDCDKVMFWADAGEIPDDPHTISPKILAEYAYDKIPVPETEVEMNPDGKQTVNLPTWMWLDETTFKPVEVTARLPGTGLWATTTAKPVSLHLDPGTKDVELHPSSGECRINDKGDIGAPYSKQDGEGDPPCGVTYLRSTPDGQRPYELKATLTWEIEWEGSGGTGGDLPDGTFDSTTPVTVREIQAINR
ncbi:hypothetical protein CRI70_12280 [Streptomyces sp. Ru87]|uniref:Secreted protein n=2 Tax=Streptomyces TaxID=1883 RepID=A0ABQ7FBM7_9ACTN|nr:hypothetical protein GCU69_27210 [Streptomyces lycii]PGH50405.1 hypothetical protein CRI70_12280 [Streptomyces sp. Ru87]